MHSRKPACKSKKYEVVLSICSTHVLGSKLTSSRLKGVEYNQSVTQYPIGNSISRGMDTVGKKGRKLTFMNSDYHQLPVINQSIFFPFRSILSAFALQDLRRGNNFITTSSAFHRTCVHRLPVSQ